ncbi:LacI family DNA-binding transcriptional regulator [Agromyces sp. MMS24-JH15]|uniref:LacI family DNA-binding transcriptional regulator n=1 Tax=Agromyces sp. MMS24-JH15 TaxID=3243765 RepID=UPI00374A3DAE
MPRATRPTMKDVARASGVSPATVSFVLNDSAGQTIPEETRARVHRAATELGYVPHGVARALREGTSRVVVLQVARLPHGSGVMSGYIDGLDDELGRLGHTLLVRYGDRADGTARLVDAISPRAILDLDRIYEADAPELADGGWVDGLAAHTAVQFRHLAERGHTGIALALRAGERFERLGDIRLAYARAVAPTLGLRGIPTLTVGRSLDDDLAAVRDLRATHPEVTAIAGLDDDAALRVMSAAHRLGLAVPDDLAVIGFDDTAAGELFSPSLTTLRVDAAAFGRRAARVLLGRPVGELAPGAATVVQRESA